MAEYMKSIRKMVGHFPVLQCGASVIVENADGEILLQLRKDNGCWSYAGGSIEIDEVIEDAAKRELREETGLIAHELEFLGFFLGKIFITFIPMGMKFLILTMFLFVKIIAVN